MDTTELVPPPSAAPASWWEDFIDIYVSPRQVFNRRMDGRFLPALIFVTVMMALLVYASQGPLGAAYEAEFIRGIEQAQQRSGGQIDEAQLQQVRGAWMGVTATAGTLIGIPIGALLTGALILLIGKFVDAKTTFELAFTVATYAQFPKLLQMSASIVQGFALEPTALNQVSIGPARFVGVGDPVTVAILGRLDLFVIWSTIVLAIGMQVTGRIPASRAYFAAILVWVIASLPIVVGAIAAGG